MDYAKGMDAAQGAENERRGWDKERYDRKFDCHGNDCHYDWFRRHLNFEIVKGKIMPITSQSIPIHERLQNRLDEIGFKHYKNGARNAPNILMDFIIGGNCERLRDMAFKNQEVNFDEPDEKNASVQLDQEIISWALDTYHFLANRYGEENIIGFNVHLDETTPHIHTQVIPVAETKKRGRVKAGEQRGTKPTVSFAGVIGDEKDSLSKYLDQMHTDYHLQVGYKYGLERGSYFDDLTPEEQAERMHRNKKQYVQYMKLKKANEELTNANEEMQTKLDTFTEQLKQLEKKVKSFTTMLANLEEKKSALEIDITALEEIRDTNNEEVERKLKENQRLLDAIVTKISTRERQLSEATQQLENIKSEVKTMDEKMENTKKAISQMADDAIKRQDRVNERLQETVQRIKDTDRSGMIERRDRYSNDRDGIIFSIWPEAKEALTAMVQRASKPANMFTKEQAERINNALDKYPKGRESGAEALEKMSEREFNENHHVNNAWIPETLKEVKMIAKCIHPLSKLLGEGRSNGGGSASYITDMTDWAGNQVKR